jgi:HlyD family secretion protein
LTDGVVEAVLVLEGQPVSKGQVVARLVADDAKLALARAEAEAASRRAALKAATETWDNPVERDRAVAATAAMRDDAAAELARLPLDIDTERARLKELQVDYQTKSELNERAISRLDVAQAKYKFEAQQAAVRSLEAKRASLEAKVRQFAADAAAAKENRRLRTDEARALAEAEAAVRLADVAVTEAKLRLERTEVKSPADGVVMQRLVEPGSKVMFVGDMVHSAHVARLYDPRRLQVRVDVPLADAAKVGVGQAARVTVDVLPDRTFDGVVTRAVHEADVQKNTQQFKVAIKDPAEQLKPEMLAKVKFLGGARAVGTGRTSSPPETNVEHPTSNVQRPTEDVTDGGNAGGIVFAPESLLHKEGDAYWTLALDLRERRAMRRTIVPGDARRDGWVSIDKGLAAGDRLIVAERPVADGQRVRVIGEASDEQLRTSAAAGNAAAAKGGDRAAD